MKLRELGVAIRRPRRVRTMLVLMTLALVVPALVFGGFLVAQFAALQRTQIELRLKQVAADLAQDVDRDLQRVMAVLDTLAQSDRLARRDYGGFHQQAQAAMQRIDGAVLVVDRAGQQLLNTRVPYGTQLPKIADPDSVAIPLATNTPYVSNLLLGKLAKLYVYNIAVPLTRKNSLASDQRTDTGVVLIVAISTEHLLEMMKDLHLPTDWVLGLSDRKGQILARSSEHNQFVGQKLPDHLLAESNRQSSVFMTTNVKGIPTVRAVAHSKIAGWMVSASVPRSMVTATVNQSLRTLTMGGAALLLLALTLASLFARWVIVPMQTLAASAAYLQSAEFPQYHSSPIEEVNRVAAALRSASIELKVRAGRLKQSERRLYLAQRTAQLTYVDYDLVRNTAVASETFATIFGFQPPDRGGTRGVR